MLRTHCRLDYDRLFKFSWPASFFVEYQLRKWCEELFLFFTLTLTLGRANMGSEGFDILECGSDLAHANPPSIGTRSRNPSKSYQR